MIKEFEYLDDRIKTLEFRIAHPNEYNITPTIKVKINDGACYKKELKTLIAIKQALTELKQIKEAKPSEALEWIEEIKNYFPYVDLGNGQEYVCQKEFSTISQALLKAQEQEKEIAELNQHIKRWHDLLLKTGINSKGTVVDEIENYWRIKAEK